MSNLGIAKRRSPADRQNIACLADHIVTLPSRIRHNIRNGTGQRVGSPQPCVSEVIGGARELGTAKIEHSAIGCNQVVTATVRCRHRTDDRRIEWSRTRESGDAIAVCRAIELGTAKIEHSAIGCNQPVAATTWGADDADDRCVEGMGAIQSSNAVGIGGSMKLRVAKIEHAAIGCN